MKKVSIVYSDRNNPGVMDSIEACFKRIFGSLIQIDRYFFTDLKPGEKINADAVVLIRSSLIYPMKEHLDSMKNVIIMTRSIVKSQLPKLLQIPQDSEVLVVNEGPRDTAEALYMLMELGINHIKMIPFDPAQESSGIYHHLNWAVTPAEPQLVPEYIEHVVDIGYREVGFETMVKLKNMLEFHDDTIERNLLLYLQYIVEPNTSYHTNYLENFLKSRILDELVSDRMTMILALKDDGEALFLSERARDLIPDREIGLSLLGEPVTDKLISIGDVNYLMNRSIVETAGWKACTLITLKSELNIRDTENVFQKRLREKGAFARYSFDNIVGASAEIKECITMAKKAATTDYTILLRGESGSGKELFAQSIHNYSARRNKPFVAINCASIPDTLLESELFGYEGGSFTGAKSKGKTGLFEQANGGTIFLDEIGDISSSLQSTLLRVLQEKQIMRIGSSKTINVDVRVITATNRELAKMVENGDFRNDLYYRLSVIPIKIPALRERKGDVEILLQHFAGNEYEDIWNLYGSVISSYDWPGNVRELENAVTFYRVLGKFPIEEKETETKELPLKRIKIEDTLKSIRKLILRKLYENGLYMRGTGRPELLCMLKEKGCEVSEGRLREIMYQMENEGLIIITKGRKGTILTEKGQEILFERTD